MASEMEAALRRFFMDPDYWRPRLARLERTPKQLVLVPRPEDSRPGTELLELRLRAHDGERLVALLARMAFGQRCQNVHLHSAPHAEADAIDWGAVENGTTDVVFGFPPQHRLEDRVLDVLRVTRAACEVESVDGARAELGPCGPEPTADAVCIARMIREKGWG